jgi:tight adherence protein C
MALAISVAVFVAVASVIILFGYRRYVIAGRVYESLGTAEEVVAPYPPSVGNPEPSSRITRAAEFVGVKLPPSAETASALQLKLLAAGYRQPNAVAILYGLKLMLTASVTFFMLLMELNSPAEPIVRIFGLLVGIFAGFKLPDYFLSKRVARRKVKLRKALPDALDLIVVCAEAGLTIDRCFRNVSQQLGIVHPELCDEFSLFTAEISAGLRRREALENLASRTQETEIRKFVAVLAQADRFGTSMAEALRTHADYLRMRRRQEAEEKASKVGVKLIFPIFFFIMPCMILVTVGPAAIAIVKQLGSVFGGK